MARKLAHLALEPRAEFNSRLNDFNRWWTCA